MISSAPEGIIQTKGGWDLTEVSNMDGKCRCKWCNENNPRYVAYHDTQWGKFRTEDQYLYEMLILESFQAGLSWECVLNKMEAFRTAYDHFDLDKVVCYDEDKINSLVNDKSIIRHRGKIVASVENSKIFRQILGDYGSFYDYLKTFTQGKILYETGKITNSLSDAIAKDLQKRGMRFVGSKVIYAYLQAIGIVYSHDENCYLYKSRV